MAIKKYREAAEMSQQELADILGVGRSAVAMWETGQALPRVESLAKMAQLFGCTMDELVKKEG